MTVVVQRNRPDVMFKFFRYHGYLDFFV